MQLALVTPPFGSAATHVRQVSLVPPTQLHEVPPWPADVVQLTGAQVSHEPPHPASKGI